MGSSIIHNFRKTCNHFLPDNPPKTPSPTPTSLTGSTSTLLCTVIYQTTRLGKTALPPPNLHLPIPPTSTVAGIYTPSSIYFHRLMKILRLFCITKEAYLPPIWWYLSISDLQKHCLRLKAGKNPTHPTLGLFLPKIWSIYCPETRKGVYQIQLAKILRRISQPISDL